MERVIGIEPTQPAWKAGTLPLSYTRNNKHIKHFITNLSIDWWREKDSNLRTPKWADLQSAAINRSAIPPYICSHAKLVYSITKSYQWQEHRVIFLFYYTKPNSLSSNALAVKT